MPLKSEGMSKPKAFLYGTLSGIVEPIGAVITLAITGTIQTVLPYLLSFAAGAMMYVVVEELIPESQNGEHSNIGTIGFACRIFGDDDIRCSIGIIQKIIGDSWHKS